MTTPASNLTYVADDYEDDDEEEEAGSPSARPGSADEKGTASKLAEQASNAAGVSIHIMLAVTNVVIWQRSALSCLA